MQLLFAQGADSLRPPEHCSQQGTSPIPSSAPGEVSSHTCSSVSLTKCHGLHSPDTTTGVHLMHLNAGSFHNELQQKMPSFPF